MENEENLEKRFWAKVNILGKNDCWNWKASVDTPGYGAFKYNGKKINSNRMVWFLTYKEFPDLLVCHTCDNRLCCNPNHLFLGTSQDNVQDMISKSRHGAQRGKESPLYKEAKHGEILSYKHGCRCQKCKNANALSKREYRRKNK